MDLDFYWDEAGDPRVRAASSPPSSHAAAAEERLGRFLESDVQSNGGQAREIVHTIDRVLAGRLRSWSETGNAHTLTLTPRGATLESTLDEAAKPVRLALDDLRQAVASWAHFLESGRPQAGPPPPV